MSSCQQDKSVQSSHTIEAFVWLWDLDHLQETHQRASVFPPEISLFIHRPQHSDKVEVLDMASLVSIKAMMWGLHRQCNPYGHLPYVMPVPLQSSCTGTPEPETSEKVIQGLYQYLVLKHSYIPMFQDRTGWYILTKWACNNFEGSQWDRVTWARECRKTHTYT